jgi:TPP-dependent pyruvate/acetoin dehydrogenase alpha subunit
MGHHSTADDATHYRQPEVVEEWKKKDPIARFKKYLISKKLWDEAKEAALLKDAEAMVQHEIQMYERIPPLNPLDMFNNNYKTATWALIEQRKELEELIKIKQTRKEVPELPPVEGRFP